MGLGEVTSPRLEPVMIRPYDLPPLTMLRTFEAAARRGAFNAAAAELNVTPGAVSHQVKALEKEIGTTLFVRGHRNVELTDEGAQLYQVLQGNFLSMSRMVQRLRQRGEEKRMTIGATTDVSYLWLTPRIISFWKDHSDFVINQQLTNRRIPRPLTVDIAIEYCVEPPDEADSVKLFEDRLMPICSPDMARSLAGATLDDLAEMPLIHMDMPEQSWMTWPKWFEQMGCTKTVKHDQFVNNYCIALQMAREGGGVVLGWHALVAPLLEQGVLVSPTNFQCAAPGGYYMTVSGASANPAAQVFADWMIGQFT